MVGIKDVVIESWDFIYEFFDDTYGIDSGNDPEYEVLQGTSFEGGVQDQVIAIEYTGYTMDPQTARGVLLTYNVFTLILAQLVTEKGAVETHCDLMDALNTKFKTENGSPTLPRQHPKIDGQVPFEIEFEGAGYVRVVRNQITVKALICELD